MPISGSPSAGQSAKPFFDSLSQLDTWASKPDEKLCNILPYVPRNCISDPNVANRGKLLVCHDFKGGYTESPESLSYTYNFWSTIDVFVYFSHHRVTIPPPAWINAAHRHGVKMLGVVIFEHEEHDADFRRLLSDPGSSNEEDAFSGYYATILADLAHQRGFDGFLLNFERPLPGGADQAGLVAVWIRFLREELWKQVGPHAEAIWYDSVNTTGKVKYQNKLNNLNLPFFLASTGLFSNYFWKEEYPVDTIEYFLSLDSGLLVQNEQPSVSHTLTQRDIYIGIDVWGRGTFGGGGFCVHKAMEKISPHALGLSVALFAPAWTWERRQDDMGRTWSAWWDEEVTFWAGKVPGLDLDKLLLANAMDQNAYFLRQGKVPMLDLDKLLLRNEDQSAYKPVADFFVTKPPPDPKILPFFTTFCPGIGNGWWVEGEKVWNGPEGDSKSWTSGWLDIDKSCSMGNLLWPIPTVSRCEDAQSETVTGPALPSIQVSINLTDAWNGGSSVKLSFLQSESGMDDYCSLWIPVQSFSLTPGEDYTATAAYKLESMENGADVDVELQIRPLPVESVAVLERMNPDASYPLRGSWRGLRTSIRIQPTGNDPHHAEVALGLKFNFRGRVSAKQQPSSVTLGQMTIYASQREWRTANNLRFNATDVKEDVSKNHEFEGVLTWEESSGPNSTHYKPAYWNVYVEPSPSIHSVKEDIMKIPGNATWIGTSGVECGGGQGKLGCFAVTGRNLSTHPSLTRSWGTVGKLRLFTQAVTCCGEIAGAVSVLYTDVDIKRES